MLKALKRFIPGSEPFNQTFGLNLPDADEVKWLLNSIKHSPDLGWLEQKEGWLYFATDEMKSGHPRYKLGSGAVLCTGYTEKLYNFWYQDEGNDRVPIPMLAQGDHTVRYFPPPLRIQGELQYVPSSSFQQMDDYKRNTLQFRRQRVNILVPYHVESRGDRDEHGKELPKPLQGKNHTVKGPERVYVIRAWMYVGRPEYWNDVLDAGFRGFKTVRHVEGRRPWLKGYYTYPKQGFK